MSGLGGGISDIGGAVGDLFSAEGSFGAAKEYKEAATLALENVDIEKQATAIKETQQQRMFEKTIGAQRADVAGNGFGSAGSALDLLRSSTAEGALAHATIAGQGFINEQAYKEQAAGYRAAATQATAAGEAGLASGFGKLIGGGASMAGMFM